MSRTTAAQLGTSDTVLLELRQNRAARRWQTTDLGLYHTAFLLPTRGDLGRWLNHAIASNLTIRGSDHRVTEAIYLTDPEGNGVELYADRPRSTWQWTNGTVDMTIDPLDLDAIRDSAFPGQWQGVPDGTVVGHLNLNVGSLPEADSFYANVLGFDITCRLPGASFFASGGYHHHLENRRTAGADRACDRPRRDRTRRAKPIGAGCRAIKGAGIRGHSGSAIRTHRPRSVGLAGQRRHRPARSTLEQYQSDSNREAILRLMKLLAKKSERVSNAPAPSPPRHGAGLPPGVRRQSDQPAEHGGEMRLTLETDL